MAVSGDTSDGYHSFNELYAHRHALFLALGRVLAEVANEMRAPNPAWRSRSHADGGSYDGWFILGINREPGQQISYHLPARLWGMADFAVTLDRAPAFDGHTSTDVLSRLDSL